MKRLFFLVVVFVLVGVGLTAADQLPPPNQTLQGTMRWQRANVCGVSDFVPLQAMNNVYLTGKFQPSAGELQGCTITAAGFYYKLEQCTYFSVSTYRTVCPATAQTVVDH